MTCICVLICGGKLMVIVKLYETVTVLYTLVVFLRAFSEEPPKCVIRNETNILPRDSSYASVRMEAKQKCDDIRLILQHFDYSLNVSVDSGSDESTLNYTCCGSNYYEEGELVSCKYIFTVRDKDCSGRNTQATKIRNDCRRISNKSYAAMWEPHERNYSCFSPADIRVKAFVCCEIASISDCVRNEGGCEVFSVNTRNGKDCYNASQIRIFAYDHCANKLKELRSLKLGERCFKVQTGGNPTGYKRITYACCPVTTKEEINATIEKSRGCDGSKAMDHCKAGAISPQYICGGTIATTATIEHNCNCFGEPDISFAGQYACCLKRNICSRIRSEAFPNHYFFKETLYKGSDIEYTVQCYEGSISRVCTRNGIHATWGGERNNDCKMPDICDRIPSDAFPNDYFFDETVHEGIDILSTVYCHEGILTRVCSSKNGIKPTWGIEVDNDCKTLEMTLNEAKNDTAKGKQLSSNDLNTVIGIVNSAVTEATKNNRIAEKMLSVIGNLMRMDILFDVEREMLSPKIISIVEKFSSQLQISDNVSNVISTRDVTVGAFKIDRLTEPLVVQSYFQKNDTARDTEQIYGPRVTIPREVLQNLRETNDRIQIITYGNPMLFLNSKSMMYMIDNFYSVVTILVDHETVFENNKTVIMYKIPRDENDSRSFTCVFWDKKIENWSRNGIDLITDKNGHKICRSTHLSSFCILMDTNTDQRLSKDNEQNLTYISYTGCGVSVLGLLATILTYALFKSLHGDEAGQILLNICVSMLLLNIIFLIGSLNSANYYIGVCMAVAILLHYFLLTTLLWMMIEALNMYQMLIVVFSKRGHWFMRKRLIAGWGIPLVVVGLTLAVSSDNYRPNNQFCFLSYTNQAAFFAAVLAPACVILFINTYVFIRVSMIVLRHSKLDNQLARSSPVSLIQVRGAVSVMIVLGITWILGPLSIGSAKVVFSYMFAILNSIQGFLMFLFRCWFNREARVSWRYLLSTGKLKHGSLPPPSASTGAKLIQNAKRTIENGSDTKIASKCSCVSQSIANSSGISSDTRSANIASRNHQDNSDDQSTDTHIQPLCGLVPMKVHIESLASQNYDSKSRASQDQEMMKSCPKKLSIMSIKTNNTVRGSDI